MILVPQSMAYASLAGLPVVYGLYASFLPVIVASMWGASRFLHTGPVAMLSLMSAAAIIPFASPGSATFIELSVMLALMVGVLRLSLGLFKLGSIVNLLSSPVIVGFTNAAALIIGLSPLSKIIGVPFPRSDRYIADLWHVVEQIGATHWPTLAFAVGAYLLIWGLRRISGAIPGVLIAVVVATAISAAIGFERKVDVPLNDIEDQAFVDTARAFADSAAQIKEVTERVAALAAEISRLEEQEGLQAATDAAQRAGELRLLRYQRDQLEHDNNARRVALHRMALEAGGEGDDTIRFHRHGQVPAGLKNLFLLVNRFDVGHKPALITAVSSGDGGAYPVAELRMSSYKNNRICYIPEQIIVRNVERVLNEDSQQNNPDADSYFRDRIAWTLGILRQYCIALKQVRDSGATGTDVYNNGM